MLAAVSGSVPDVVNWFRMGDGMSDVVSDSVSSMRCQVVKWFHTWYGMAGVKWFRT